MRYDADLTLIADNSRIEIEVLSTVPENANPVEVELATEYIRRGVERILQQRNEGALIRLHRLVIHPVDFKPRRFEQFTAEELQRVLKKHV